MIDQDGRTATQQLEHDRLKTFWNQRYVEFSLRESGINKLSPKHSELLYRCKENAYRRAIKAGGVDPRSNVSILDGGCGQGFFAAVTEQLLPSAKYTGVDISDKAIAYLRTKYPVYGWECEDLCNPDFSLGRQFDIAQSIEVLHLILDDQNQTRALVNLGKHVSEGGTLIVTDTLPRNRQCIHDHIVFRPLSHYEQTFRPMGIEVVAVLPMYYCVPDVGARGSRMGRAWRMLPPGLLGAVDRIGVALRLPSYSATHDSKMKMIVCRKRG